MTVKQARKILGKEFKEKSDQEIKDLIDQLYMLAEIAADSVIKSGSNSQQGVIDSSEAQATK